MAADTPPRRAFLMTGMSERRGIDAAVTRVAGNADPEEAAPPKAPTLRLEDDDAFAGGRTTGATAAAAGDPLLVPTCPMPRSARRSASDRVHEAATERFPEREAFGAIATKGSSELRDSLKTVNHQSFEPAWL